MKANTYKVNWPLRIASLLACLVLVTTTMLAGFYAKFITTDSAEDSARVAAFHVASDLAEQEQKLTVRLAPGETMQYPISITSRSEAAVRYTVEVIRETENLPIRFAWDSSTGTFAPNSSESKTVTLTITWPVEQNNWRYSHEIDLITVKLTAEQID